MIKSSIKIHDNYSAVIETSYDKALKRKKTEYTCITYLFFPNSLNINKGTYPNSKFYNDIRLFIKYNRPDHQLDKFIDTSKSPLSRLRQSIVELQKNNSAKNNSIYEEQVKMFASIYCILLAEKTSDLISTEKEFKLSLLTTFLKTIQTILVEFRVLVDEIEKSSLNSEDKKIIYHADEHMSNILELQMMHLFNALHEKIPQKDSSAIVAIINKEQKYKKHTRYSSVKDKLVDPEDLLYRRSQLKKYIDSVFFLNQDIRQDGEIFEQSLLAIAAGLAMIFATGIAFYYQIQYGNFTAPFFAALVIGYMLKDRIKGILSKYFISKSNILFYDFKINIIDSLKRKIGLIKERFEFISLDKLDSKVKNYRLEARILKTKILGEQIIRYKKKVILYSKKFGSISPDEDIAGITDISRFNFLRLTKYMDDPEKNYILIKKGEIYTKVADKVYPINIIQQYFTEDGLEFKQYRIIMNRNGIKRIDEVVLS
jgi:hypothetical protein